jgi:hypothetical protein
MQTDPTSVVQLDLTTTQQLWNALKQELSSFSAT